MSIFNRKKKRDTETFDNPNYGVDPYAEIDDLYNRVDQYHTTTPTANSNPRIMKTDFGLRNNGTRVVDRETQFDSYKLIGTGVTEYDLPGTGVNFDTNLPGTGTEFTTYGNPNFSNNYGNEHNTDDENGYMTIEAVPRANNYEVDFNEEEYDEEVGKRNTLIQNWIDGNGIDLSQYETEPAETEPAETEPIQPLSKFIMLDDKFFYSQSYSSTTPPNGFSIVIHFNESNSQETHQSSNCIRVGSNIGHLMDEELLEQIHEAITLALGKGGNVLFVSKNFDKVVFIMIAFKILTLQEYVPLYEVYVESLTSETKEMIQRISDKFDKKKGIAVNSIQNVFPEIPADTIIDLFESGLSMNQIIEQFVS